MQQRSRFPGLLLLAATGLGLAACGEQDDDSFSARGALALACDAGAGPAPVAAGPRKLLLWPPNHKFHTISVSDCVTFTDSCDGPVSGEFIWASSDEPIDGTGDGHHAPDVQLDSCGAIAVRAERAGPKDGRVYKLGVRVVNSQGLATESECAVIVDHDQRGVLGTDSGEAYRIVFDGSQGGPVCDGITTPPAPPVVMPPVTPPPVVVPDAGVETPDAQVMLF